MGYLWSGLLLGCPSGEYGLLMGWATCSFWEGVVLVSSDADVGWATSVMGGGLWATLRWATYGRLLLRLAT